MALKIGFARIALKLSKSAVAKYRLFMVLMLCTFIFGCGQPKMNSLVGIWQDYNATASGWTNTFQFFPDQHFIFHINSMDCESRNRGYSGTWKIQSNALILDISSEQVVLGGKLVEATGSCGTTEDIDGGKYVTKTIFPTRIEKKKITQITKDRNKNEFGENYEMEMVEIDGKKYWKFEDDPSKYD